MAFISTHRAFPFCQVASRDDLPVAEVSGPTTDGYPVEVSYSKYFEWVWRVRTWRITANVTAVATENYDVLGTPYVDTFTWGGCSINSVTTGAFAQGSEDSLVCSTGFIGGSAVYNGTNDVTVTSTNPSPVYPYTTNSSVSINFTPSSTSPRWKRHGELWLPRLTVSGSLNIGQANPFTFSTIYETELPDYAYSYPSLTLDSETVSFQTVYLANVFGDTTTITFSLPITITPEEWYKYDPGDGDGPVWNSATGNRTSRSMPSGPSH